MTVELKKQIREALVNFTSANSETYVMSQNEVAKKLGIKCRLRVGDCEW